MRAGTRAELELPVARLPTGTWSAIPLVIIHGRRPGPTVWISGVIHGDEVVGVEIVRRVTAALDPRRLCGTLLAAPIVNTFGVITGSRYLPDRRDLNRSFPGSRTGSLAARLAHIFFEQVAARCDIGLDFHSGSGGRCNLPQLRCDLDDDRTREMARAFGAPIMVDSRLRDGSLRARACKAGIRVLLFETGEALRFDEHGIDVGVHGTLRVLAHLNMIDGGDAPAAAAEPLVSRRSRWMRAGRSGFYHLEVELGQRVGAGQRLAFITDGIGAKISLVRSRVDGVVVGVLRQAVVHRGDAVVHVAEIEA